MLFLLLASTLTLAFKIQLVKAEPRTWIVDDDEPADFHTIQEAINAASLGDTIIVRTGTYTENVKVNKDHLTIKSESGAEVTIVQAADLNAPVLEVIADYVTINGFTMKWYVRLCVAYWHWPSKNNILVNNVVESTISLIGSHNNVLINNTVSNTLEGIWLEYSHNNTLRANTVSSCLTGILLDESHDNKLINNLVWKNRYQIEGQLLYCAGIELCLSSNNNIIANNTVAWNAGDGIKLTGGSSYNILAGNTVSNNDGDGIFLDDYSNSNTLSNNIVTSNDHAGIFLFNSYCNTINGTLSKSNNIGIGFWFSADNTIYLNDFVGNIANVAYYDSTTNVNIWHSPEKITYTYNGKTYTNYLGNYWSDYSGSDADGDGIGATPYSIDGDKDNYPLMEPFENYFQPAPVPEEWTFAIITDLHIGFYYTDYDTAGFEDSGPGQDYWLTDRLKGIVEWINTNKEAYNIHFVVVLGDIADTAEYSEFLKAREILNALNDPNGDGDISDGIPYIPVIGNHDIWPYTEKGTPFYYHLRPKDQVAPSSLGDIYFNEIFWKQNAENLQKINELFGDWRRQYADLHILQDTGQAAILQNYAFTYKGIKFIALDFVERDPDSGGPVLFSETLRWLSENLREKEPTILLSHHPIYYGESRFLDGFSSAQEAEIISSLIKGDGSDIIANFAGHNHFNLECTAELNEAGVKVVTTEAICRESTWWGSKYLGKTGSNIRIVRMRGEEFKGYYFGNIEDKTEEPSLFSFVSHSPVDLIITDPDGITVTKEVGEVAGMFYFEFDINGDGEMDDIVALAGLKMGDYLINVVPEMEAFPTDTYTLEFLTIDTTFILTENVQISNIPNQQYILRSTETEIIPIQPATVDFDPDTLNLKSKGRWVTVYIELPVGHGYDVSMIDLASLMLNDQVQAEAKPIEIGDCDSDGIPDLMVKFNRAAVQVILQVGDKVEITISGKLIDGRQFEGKDTIKVILPP